MFDFGWTEILVIAIVLIIVVGPKDLPAMLRTFGRTMSKMREMAGDFRSQFDEALKEADLDDVRKTINDAKKLNPTSQLREAVNPFRKAGHELKEDIDRTMKGSSSTDKSSQAASRKGEAAKDGEKANGASASREGAKATPVMKPGPAAKPAGNGKSAAGKQDEKTRTNAPAAAKPAKAKAASAKKPAAKKSTPAAKKAGDA